MGGEVRFIREPPFGFSSLLKSRKARTRSRPSRATASHLTFREPKALAHMCRDDDLPLHGCAASDPQGRNCTRRNAAIQNRVRNCCHLVFLQAVMIASKKLQNPKDRAEYKEGKFDSRSKLK